MRFARPALVLLCAMTVPSRAGELRVGAAQVEITPDVGTPMAGYYSARAMEGVHDPLYAKVLVLEQDGRKAALVVCDLISMTRGVTDESRKLIEHADPALPPERVMISATHSHTGPVLPTGSSRDPALAGDGMGKARQYVEALPARIADAVRRADAKLAPAKVSIGRGFEDRLSFNRRFFMKDGTVGWNPGKLNPNIVAPAGPIDPDVPVVYFESSADGRPIATYVNFAMHLDTTGGLRASADYPGTLAQLLGRVKGPDMVTLFTAGCCGDINHIDVSTKTPQHGYGEAARIGTVLAGEVLKTYARLTPVQTFGPRGKRELVSLDLPENKPGEVEAAEKVAAAFGERNKPPFLEQVKAYRVLDVARREGKPIEAEVQVIALGDDLAFVSLPGEIFVELGLSVKQQSPFRHTVIAELANGSVGYVPTFKAYAQGNYEVVSARCAAGSGEKLATTAVKLLKELKGAEAPAR
jgi:neutral ceramidase